MSKKRIVIYVKTNTIYYWMLYLYYMYIIIRLSLIYTDICDQELLSKY